MLSIPSQRGHPSEDRLSVNIVPEKLLDKDLHSPRSSWLFEDNTDEGCSPRVTSGDESKEDKGMESMKAQDKVMSEIADWLDLQGRDEFWSSRRQQPRRALPGPREVVAQLTRSHHSSSAVAADGEAFEFLLYFIALQLLASCYTLQPPSSADNVPLFQQRRGARQVTALRLHSQNRFSPAAGHHARVPSETSYWPGLYTGPSIEDQAAEIATRRRRLELSRSEPVQRVQSIGRAEADAGVSGWTDGTADRTDNRRYSQSTASWSSSSERGVLSKLICQASAPKSSKHRRHFLFLPHQAKAEGRPQQPERTNLPIPTAPRRSLETIKSHAVQRIPSMFRLRRTQSTPHDEVQDVAPRTPILSIRRNSSNPTIGSPLNYSFEIPEIRRVSASTTRANSQNSVRACGRGDMLTAKEYLDETRLDQFDAEKLSVYSAFPSPHRTYPLPPLDGVSPLNSTGLITPTWDNRAHRMSDYFGDIHIPVREGEPEEVDEWFDSEHHSPVYNKATAASEGDNSDWRQHRDHEEVKVCRRSEF